MICKYGKNQEGENGREYIYCDITEEICSISRFCTKINKVINNDNYKTTCLEYKLKENKNFQFKNKVLFEKKGYLYISTNNKNNEVVCLKNPYEYIPSAVNLAKRKQGDYYIKKDGKK